MASRKTMLVVKMDPDGDCLFHALAYHLGTGEAGGALRQRMINFMEEVAVNKPGWRSEPYLEEAGTLRAGAWGGNTALIAFSEMMGVRVTVHTKETGKDVAVKEWTHESVSDDSTAETYHLLFNGSDHYDALREVDYRPDAMQAAWEQPPPPAYAASIIESEAFPALHAEGGPAVRNKRKVGFTAPRPSKKGKAKANKKQRCRQKQQERQSAQRTWKCAQTRAETYWWRSWNKFKLQRLRCTRTGTWRT